jgi:hypothetical protein
MTDVGKILFAISLWIKKAWANIKKDAVPVANEVVTVVNGLELYTVQAAPILEDLFPKITPIVLAAIKVVAPDVVASMQIMTGVMAPPAGQDVSVTIQTMLTRIQTLLPPNTQSYAWLEFAGKLTGQVTAYLKLGPLTVTEEISLAHEIYNALHKGVSVELGELDSLPSLPAVPAPAAGN